MHGSPVPEVRSAVRQSPCATAGRVRRALAHLLAGLLALGLIPPVAAQTAPGKKSPSDRNATLKKKAQQADAPQAPLKEEPTKSPTAPNAALAPEEILEFHAQPAGVRKLIESALNLTRQNLTYLYGSADPASGGLDCSGFIYHLLRQHGLTQVPRDSSGLYAWVRKARGFRAVLSRKPDSFELDELLPGDLLFWTGTYVTDRDPPITHTMLYLGTEKSGGGKIMVGSSDGRTYRGQRRNGVSVFDFMMPRASGTEEQRTTFVGYARIPGLRD